MAREGGRPLIQTYHMNIIICGSCNDVRFLFFCIKVHVQNIKNKPQTSEQQGSIQQSTYQFEGLLQGRSVPRPCAIIIVGHSDCDQLVDGNIDNQLQRAQN